MLSRLDSIDWTALQDAYGSAIDVPDRLRALLSNDVAVRSVALHELFGSVWHQGTVYSVSAHVVPFLLELIAAPQVEDKPSIVALLASIAGGRGYYEVHEAIVQKLSKQPIDVSAKRSKEIKVVEAVRRAVSPHVPDMLPYLVYPEPEVRLAVAQALPFYPEHYAFSKAGLKRARSTESQSEVLEAFDEALTAISQAAQP